jgi:nickel/cobalt transporter (NicO) family protein
MRRVILWTGLAIALGLGLMWATGALSALSAWAMDEQRAAQGTLARAIRALRAGEAGAWAGLLSICFAYGFLHAVGPGHGKVLIGGYGVARRVPVLRLSVLALVASLAQALVAILLVGAGIWVLGWTREDLLGVGEGVLAPIGHLLIMAVGVWLVLRGLRGVWRQRVHADHGHDHHHDHDHAHCDHAHGPTPDQALAVTSLRDAAILVAGIAVRPCAGALFLLIITQAMGIALAGIVGALVMGLGTASVTVAVAVLAVWSREGALATLSDGWLPRALPVIEMAAGAVIAAVALQLFLISA